MTDDTTPILIVETEPPYPSPISRIPYETQPLPNQFSIKTRRIPNAAQKQAAEQARQQQLQEQLLHNAIQQHREEAAPAQVFRTSTHLHARNHVLRPIFLHLKVLMLMNFIILIMWISILIMIAPKDWREWALQ